MSKVTEIKSKVDFDTVIKKGGKVFVDFKAEWCGPCKMLHPLVEQLAEKRNDVTFLSVDVDENKDLAQEYQVLSIPALKVFENGKVIKESLGFQPMNQLEAMLD